VPVLRIAAIAALVYLTTFAVQARALSLNHAVQPPPARFASGPTLYGQTRERTFSDPFALERYCAFYLGRPPRGYYQACYIPALDQVVLPDARAWPSRTERALLRAHEWAHARGWRHPALATASLY
jgi:hypothetical protein